MLINVSLWLNFYHFMKQKHLFKKRWGFKFPAWPLLFFLNASDLTLHVCEQLTLQLLILDAKQGTRSPNRTFIINEAWGKTFFICVSLALMAWAHLGSQLPCWCISSKQFYCPSLLGSTSLRSHERAEVIFGRGSNDPPEQPAENLISSLPSRHSNLSSLCRFFGGFLFVLWGWLWLQH